MTRLTYTLTQLGYLEYIDRQGKYRLTPAVLALGFNFLNGLKIREIARPHMQELADFAEAAVALAGRDRLGMIYIEACAARSLATLRREVGSRLYIATSAAGRAYLSAVSDQEREFLFRQLAKTHGADWPALQARIEDGIAQVRERGFVLTDGDWQPDIRAVAAPVVLHDPPTVMTINCAGPSFAMSIGDLEGPIGKRLVHICRVISPDL